MTRNTFVLLAAAAGLFSAFADVPEKPVAPFDNPDDQIRFFWGLDWRMYDQLVPYGFNMATEHPQGSFYYEFEKQRGRDKSKDDYVALTDKMARDGFIWNIQLRPTTVKYLHEKFPRVNKDGSRFTRAVDPTAPGCLDELRRYVNYHADFAATVKCRVGFMPESEERIWTKPTFAPHAIAAYKAATGRDVPPEAEGRAAPHWSKLKGFPADRVVDKDYPLLAFYRWFWKEGDGFEKYYQVAIDAFREKLGYTPFSMYDPVVRVPPLWGSGGNVTHNSQWSMCYPHPYTHAYTISEQKAYARGCPGQGVVTIVQGIASAEQLAPTNDLPAKVPEWRRRNPAAVYVTPPPDMMREQIWAVMSRQIDGFGFHGWDSLWVKGADFGRNRDYYHYTQGESRKMIENLFAEIARPLGPLLRAIPERAPEVAVLDPYSAILLSGTGWWDWYRTPRSCGDLAEAANLAPMTLFEEEIERDGIPPSVKIILAAGCDVVTKETAAALKAFRARGGKIVADKDLAPGVTADAALPSVVPLSVNVAEWDDVDKPAAAKDANAKAYAAEKDVAWRKRVQKLEDLCRTWVRPHVEADNAQIYLRTRTYRSTDYVFAINDRRGYGDYMGPWKRVLDKGLPNEATLTVNRPAGAVYDLVRHAAVPFSVAGNETRIPVKYETCDGRLLMVADRPLGKLTYKAELLPNGKTRVSVTTKDRDVMIPVEVSAGGKTRYGVIADGKWTREVEGQGPVRVRNLADGRFGVKYRWWWPW